MLSIHFVTLFPEMVLPACGHSILARAVAAGAVQFDAVNPRDFATDPHRTVDDRPFGGGPGMVMKCEPLDAALRSLPEVEGREILFFEPWGDPFTQEIVPTLAASPDLVLVCGHYEGIDQRIQEKWATRILSLGDFVLTGGELPALVIADAVTRTLPGVLGDPESLEADSFAGEGLLGYPQYTRPREFEGRAVPDVLLSGDHGAIEKWRRGEQFRATLKRDPDKVHQVALSKSDRNLLNSLLASLPTERRPDSL